MTFSIILNKSLRVKPEINPNIVRYGLSSLIKEKIPLRWKKIAMENTCPAPFPKRLLFKKVCLCQYLSISVNSTNLSALFERLP